VEEAAHPVLRTLQRTVPDFQRDIAVVNAGLHYGVGDPGYRRARQPCALHQSRICLCSFVHASSRRMQ
jgi:hypothetical protein